VGIVTDGEGLHPLDAIPTKLVGRSSDLVFDRTALECKKLATTAEQGHGPPEQPVQRRNRPADNGVDRQFPRQVFRARADDPCGWQF
jgi:hypothetical protein